MAKQSAVNLDITNNTDGFDITGGLTSHRKLTVTGSDITIFGSGSTTMTFPTASATIAGTNIANRFTTVQNIGSGTPYASSLLFIETGSALFVEVNIENTSASLSGSADLVLGNDLATATTNYVNLGINSSIYADPSFTVASKNDSYLYAQSASLALGVVDPTGSVYIFAGGTLISNRRVAITTGSIAMTGSIFMSGSLTLSSPTAGTNVFATASWAASVVSSSFSRGGTMVNSAGVSTGNYIVWRAPYPCTVTKVWGWRTGGTGATINSRSGSTATHLVGDLSLTSADAWMPGGALQNTQFTTSGSLYIMVTGVTGTVTQVGVQVDFSKP